MYEYSYVLARIVRGMRRAKGYGQGLDRTRSMQTGLVLAAKQIIYFFPPNFWIKTKCCGLTWIKHITELGGKGRIPRYEPLGTDF